MDWHRPRRLWPAPAVGVHQGEPDDVFYHEFRAGDARRPVLILADETLDMFRGARASIHFRRMLQQGRARGMGLILVNQAPKWIDKSMVREVEYLHVGRLGYQDDARHVRRDLVPTEVATKMPADMGQYKWYFVDRVHPARSRAYELSQPPQEKGEEAHR